MLGNNTLWSDNRKNVAIEEQGRAYRALNNNSKVLSCYQIDGKLITNGIRCDYALSIDQECKIYFIELKGGDITHAASQIHSTITHFNKNLKSAAIFARIVCSRVGHPRIRRPALIRLEQLVAKTSGNVKISSLALDERI